MQIDGAGGKRRGTAGEAEASGPQSQAQGVGREVWLRAHG